MDQKVFEKIVGIKPANLRGKSILEAGAGPGDLIRTLIAWGIDPASIWGVDISPTSTKRIKELGCNSVCGRLDQVIDKIPQLVDLIFLSYFIDRDANQKKTLEAAMSCLAPGGTLVLEGLFPSQPFDSTGRNYAIEPKNLITKGKYAVEDIDAICVYFDYLAQRLGVPINIRSIASGSRYVWSNDGEEKLTTDFVTITKGATA